MKPITNILLVLSLVCYAFLPFYEISFQGSLTGFSYTAGTISRHFSLGNTVYALLPFLACFAAIGFNTLHNRRWGYAALICVLMGLYFFHTTANFHEISLSHMPEVTPSNDIGEGFSIVGLGIGYRLSCGLLVAALVTQIMSFLPFKFNERIEKAVDEGIDRGFEDIRSLGNKVSDEVQHWRRDRQHRQQPEPTEPTPPEIPKQPDPEDHSRFMPK